MNARNLAAIVALLPFILFMDSLEGAELEVVPVRASGAHAFAAGELYLQHPHQRVMFELMVSNWNLDGDGLLHLIVAQIESAGFANGAGAALVPAYESCPSTDSGGHAFCESVFEASGTRCADAFRIAGCPYDRCCEPGFIDRTRGDWLFAGRSSVDFVDLDNADLSVTYYPHCSCLGVADDGMPKYFGTLILDVPAAAAETYAIEYRESGTFLYDGDNPFSELLPNTQLPGVIHVDNSPHNRYLSLASSATVGNETAIRITLTSLYHPDPLPTGASSIADFTDFEGQVRWVGQPEDFVETPNPETFFVAAPLQCEPHFAAWKDWGPIQAFGPEIIPDSVYDVHELGPSCYDPGDPECFRLIARLRTSRWGDVQIPYSTPDGATQPDFVDIHAAIAKFKQSPGAPLTARVAVYGDVPSQQVSFQDISVIVDAFKGAAFPFSGPSDCP